MSATSKVSIASGYEPVDVDLWGTAFRTRPATRSVQARIEKIEQGIDGEEDPDKLIGLLAETVDARLDPVGHKRHASTLIVEKWKADELTLGQLQRFANQIAEAESHG